MSEDHNVRLAEQERVDKVMRLIDRQVDALSEQMGGLKEQVVDIRKHFWDDVTVNADTSDDQLETFASMKQQAELLSERERSHRQAERQYEKLRRLQYSPYFGRIDFAEPGEQSPEPIYLGTGSLLDEDGERFLVYDWRAPISSLYYDYGPGPAQYETPGGTISGTMELKRQFTIRSGKLIYVFDTGLTIGDELLQQVLGQGADAQMKNIVATIQREQNRIIRNDSCRMLIVFGPAGSGKTSAALQRVAYLLYKYRGTLAADQIVLFSPNPMFNRYVATVLPELGEENMQQTTFQQYLEHRLSGEFTLEDPFEQMEYVLGASGEPDYPVRLAGIAFKTSARFLEAIQNYKGRLEARGLAFCDIKLKGRVLVSAEELSAQFYSMTSIVKLSPRVVALGEWLDHTLKAAIDAQREEPWVQEEVDLLDMEDYQSVYKQLQREEKSSRGAFNERMREDDLLKELVLRRHYRRLSARVKRLRFVDLPETYRRLFSDPAAIGELSDSQAVPQEWPDICRCTMERLDAGKLFSEDATPYLYLRELIEGFQVNMKIRHVFIDEAQDYSPFQFAFIRKLFPRARMTALGDSNQAIYAHASATAFTGLQELYGSEWTETMELGRTYRSTRPIVEFTRSMLKDGGGFEPFNRGGELPVVTVVDDRQALHAVIAAKLRGLRAEGMQTIAVICRTAQESLDAHSALTPLSDEPLRLTKKDSASFETGWIVIPAYLAKGIEFDAVILYDASAAAYGQESERKLFYTACTRAMHRLDIYCLGTPNHFIAGADPATFVRQ